MTDDLLTTLLAVHVPIGSIDGDGSIECDSVGCGVFYDGWSFNAHLVTVLHEARYINPNEVLRIAANRWTRGEWSNVLLPFPKPPALIPLAVAQLFGDWLRAEADRIEEKP